MPEPRETQPSPESAQASAAATQDAAACPICGQAARFWFTHPDVDIYRCPACTHAFSRLDTLRCFETYDEQYYQETHRNWFLNPNRALFRWIDSQLPADAAAILDVGCGNGDFLKHLATQRPGTRLVGIDLFEPAPIDGVELLHGDVLERPLEETFDAVVSLAVVEHVPAVLPFAQRMAQLCKPGGSVVMMTLNGDGLLYQSARLGRRLGLANASDRLYSSHHLHHFTPASLRGLLERAGLEVTSVHHHNAPMKSVDVPAPNAPTRAVLKSAVALCFAAGKLSGRCYLQTMVCRRTGD